MPSCRMAAAATSSPASGVRTTAVRPVRQATRTSWSIWAVSGLRTRTAREAECLPLPAGASAASTRAASWARVSTVSLPPDGAVPPGAPGAAGAAASEVRSVRHTESAAVLTGVKRSG